MADSRKFLFILLLVAMIAISACDIGDGEKTKGRAAKDVQGVFIGGSEALSLQFEENSPPQTIFAKSGQTFDIEVKLKNNGETEVPGSQVKVKISGLNPADLKGLSSPLLSSLDQDVLKREKTPEGAISEPAEIFARYIALSYEAELHVGASKDIDLRAELCYPYSTQSLSELCILQDPLGLGAEDKVCNFAEIVPTANSGAPVQVTNIKENPRKDEIQFVFTIAHNAASDGKTIYRDGTDCFMSDASEIRRHENLVLVNVDTLNKLSSLSCSGFTEKLTEKSGYVKLSSDGTSSSLICKFPVSSASTDFSEFVNIDLKYQYKDRVQKTINVKSSG